MLKVYYLRLSDFDGCKEERFYPDVAAETRIAVGHYRNERTRRTKLLGEAMTRNLLELQWGLGREEYRIGRAEHGKPHVEGTFRPVFFNISHSGDYIVCALSEQEVGVDIERKGKARMEVARRFFHPEEIRRLENLAGDERNELFFGYWSAKESFLKYTGSGLTAPLSGFEVRLTGEKTILEREAVCIRECHVDSEYRCFVCSPDGETPEVLRFDLFDGQTCFHTPSPSSR